MKYRALRRTFIFSSAIAACLVPTLLRAQEQFSLPTLGTYASGLVPNLPTTSAANAYAGGEKIGGLLPKTGSNTADLDDSQNFMARGEFTPRATVPNLVSKVNNVTSSSQIQRSLSKLSPADSSNVRINWLHLLFALSALKDMSDTARIAGGNEADGACKGHPLAANEMGVYEYEDDSAHAPKLPSSGCIVLNQNLQMFNDLAGAGLVSSVLVHEAYHRSQRARGLLNGQDTPEIEADAFVAQSIYLNILYPNGNPTGWQRMILDHKLKLATGEERKQIRQALAFIATMDRLWKAHGDRADILENIAKPLYPDPSHPSSAWSW